MSGLTTPMRQATPGGRGFQGQMTTPGKMDQGFGGNTGGANVGLTGLQNQVQKLTFFNFDMKLWLLRVMSMSDFLLEG